VTDNYRIRIGKVAGGALAALALLRGQTLERAAADAIKEALRRETAKQARRIT